MFADERAVTSYAKDMCFSKRDVLFLSMICSSENIHIKRRILEGSTDPDLIARKISDDLGYSFELTIPMIMDIRSTLSGDHIIPDNEMANRSRRLVSDIAYSRGPYSGEVVGSTP